MWNSMSANNCNTYLIDGPTRVLVDPGHLGLFSHVEMGLRQIGAGISDIELVICTHAHPDHFEAVQLFKKDTQALFAIHETDWHLVKEMARYSGGAFDVESCAPDFFLQEGNLDVKGLELHVIHTPGHSPGSVSVYWPGKRALFTGDVLFKDGLGRTDLPGGSGETLKASIRRLAGLDSEWILPGHGDFISGAKGVRSNFERVEQFWFRYI
ncbi:MAG: MBL fold metallo-hydrolase [Syntrophobacteraceae bacterium]|nr:MBL fold metallo-hydrolase [Syntrophobacteraceae bacterium]